MSKVLVSLLILSLCSSCGVYSLSGSSYDPTIYTTFSVDNFINNSGEGPPDLAQQFTEDLRDYFQQNTQLKLVNSNGDVQFDGIITKYQVLPTATIANDVATQNRLTIAVEVNYTDTKNEDNTLTQTFSFFGDFDQNQAVTDVEDQLIDDIYEQIILDIFNKTASNW